MQIQKKSLFKKKQMEVLNFETPLNVSFYHFVCDANVRSDKGNSATKTLQWIIQLLQNQDQELLDLAINLQKMNGKLQDLILKCQFKIIYSTYRFESEISQAMLFTGGLENIQIHSVEQIIDEYAIKLKLENNIIDIGEDICYEGGTTNHAISFYISGNILTICNSGEGLNYSEFHANLDDKYEVIAQVEIKPNRKWHIIATIILCSDYDKTIFNTTQLYELLSPNVNKLKQTSYMFPSQLSGSCTFWSTFYLILFRLQNKWYKNQLEAYLLKLAINYFIENAPKLKYGYEGLVSCIQAKCIKFGIELPLDFAKNAYKDCFLNKYVKFEPLEENDQNKLYILTSDLAYKSKKTKDKFSSIESLYEYDGDEKEFYVSGLNFYFSTLKILNSLFTTKTNNYIHLMCKLMKLFFKIRYNLKETFVFYATLFIHLEQLIVCLLLVLNEYSTEKLWFHSKNYEDSFELVCNYFFTFHIWDLSQYKPILMKYGDFWKAFLYSKPFEVNVTLDYDQIFKKTLMLKGEEEYVYLYAWLFPHIVLTGLMFKQGKRQNINNIGDIVMKILANVQVINKSLKVEQDKTKFNYEYNQFDFKNVEFKTNDFFDFNILLIDRIANGEYTETEITQNLPINRLQLPLFMNSSSLFWPLSHKEEFNSQKAYEELLLMNLNILEKTSQIILTYLATLFFLTTDKIPLKLINVITDEFFKNYIKILLNQDIQPVDIFNMLQVFKEIEEDFEFLFITIALARLNSNIFTLEFSNEVLVLLQQTHKIDKLKLTFPKSKLIIKNSELTLDGNKIFYFKINDSKKDNFDDQLSELGIYWKNKIYFYNPQTMQPPFSDQYESLLFLNQGELVGKKFDIVFENQFQYLLYDSKKYIRKAVNHDMQQFWDVMRNDHYVLRFTLNEKDEIIMFINEHFAIGIFNDIKYMMTSTKKFEIIEQQLISQKRFCSFPESCILYDGNVYYLFLRHLKDYEDREYSSPWAKGHPITSIRNKKKKKQNQKPFKHETFVLIPIALNSSHLIFQDAEQALCYLKLCVYYQEVDGLYLHFNQLLYLIQTSSSISSQCYEFLDYFDRSFNNPYSHYFQYLWSIGHRNEFSGIRANDNDFNFKYGIEWPSIGSNLIDNDEQSSLHESFSPKNNAFESRKNYFPIPFQLLKNQESLQSNEFSNEFLNLLKTYVNLLKENIYQITKREAKENEDQAINSWLQTLDGKEVCKLYPKISEQVLINIKQTKKNVLKQVQDLEYQLTLLIIINCKQLTLSTILYMNTNLLATAMATRILANALENIHTIDSCELINKYSYYLDSKHIYTGKRSLQYLYLEYMLGFFIRKDQHAFIEDYLIDKTSYIQLRELLMGLGKTSVILPLLVGLLSMKKTFIVVPKHMHKESNLNLAKYSESYIFPLTETTREDPFTNIGQIMNLDINCWLMDDIEFKKIQLNRIVWYNRISNYNEIFEILENVSVIVDEFDSLYNPSTSVLQYPIGEVSIEATGVSISIWKDLIRLQFNKKPKLEIIDKHLLKAIKMKNHLKLNLHYGFSHIDSLRLSVVPYMYANKPIEGSSFSFVLLQFLLTFRLHYQTIQTQKFHIDHILIFFNQHIFKPNIKNPDVIKKILKKLNLHEIFQLQDIFYIQYLGHKKQLSFISNKLGKILKFEFIYKFVKEIVLPQLGDTDFVIATSFLEAIYKNKFKKIYAFSGTTNLILPDEIIPKEEEENKGAIHYAMKFYQQSIIWSTEKSNLENLSLLIRHLDLDAFMDAGAFLLGEDIEQLCKELSYLKDILFFTIDGDKKYASKGIISNYRFEKLPINCIILYDQASCIGVNIIQRIPMIGFVSVDIENSKYEFIAQAMFRLRSINHGHTIRIITKEKSIKTNDILTQLHINSHDYIHVTQEPYRLLQTLIYKSNMKLLRPKFSEIRFHGSYLSYLSTCPPNYTSLPEFKKYKTIATGEANLKIQVEIAKQKSTEQKKEQIYNGELLSECGLAYALKFGSRTNKILKLLNQWGIYFDSDFDLFQFAAIIYPLNRFDMFIAHIKITNKNVYQKTKLSAPIPFYYQVQDKNKFLLVPREKSLKHTDEKDAPFLLRWLNGARLNYKQQFDLDIWFLKNSNYEDVSSVIHCLNTERIASFGDIKRIKNLFNFSEKEYITNLITNHKFAENFGFFDFEHLKTIIIQT